MERGAGRCVHHDLAHVEIAVRNAYSRALERGTPFDTQHWVFEPDRHFPPDFQRAANGKIVDANAKARRLLTEAVAQARSSRIRSGSPSDPAHGKVIAEIGFGFWRYLTTKRHHAQLWVPYLHRVFPPGTARVDVDRPVGRLHELRNRVAHHEPLRGDLAARYEDVQAVVRLLNPPLAEHIVATTRIPRLLAERPCFGAQQFE